MLNVNQLFDIGVDKLTMTFLTKLAWFLYNVTNFSTLLITAVYWIVIFTPGSQLEAINFFVHAFNSIVSVVDLFVGKRPCNLLHFYHPFTALLAYTAFSVIYWAAGGRTKYGVTYIYSVLNWNNLGLTIPFVCIGLFVGIPIVHVILWALHKLRDFLCCSGSVSNREQKDGQDNKGYNDAMYM